MNFNKYKHEFLTFKRGQLNKDTYSTLIKPLEVDITHDDSFLDLVEYKRQIDLLKEQTMPDFTRFTLDQLNKSYLSQLLSSFAKYLAQELLLKFKQLSFDLQLNQTLSNLLDNSQIMEIPFDDEESETTSSKLTQPTNLPCSSDLYTDLFLFSLQLSHSRIPSSTYYSLLATLHCLLMTQQSHLFDASLIVIEKEHQTLIVGIGLRSYQQVLISQIIKRREVRYQGTTLGIKLGEVTIKKVDKIMSNENEVIQTYLRTKGSMLDCQFTVESCLLQSLKSDRLTYDQLKHQQSNLVNFVQQFDYTLRKLLIKKCNYPSELSLLNGVLFTILNSDEFYHTNVIIIIPDDHSSDESDELTIYMIIQKQTGEKQVQALDIAKKSQIQVELTQQEQVIRNEYKWIQKKKEEESKGDGGSKERYTRDKKQVSQELRQLDRYAEKFSERQNKELGQIIEKYERYTEIVQSKEYYRKVKEDAQKENWNQFFKQGQLMPFGKVIGFVINDLMSFEKDLIKDIFNTLGEQDLSQIDYQSIFMKLLSDVIFQSFTLGDQALADILVSLYLTYKDELWAQCLIVQLIQDALLTNSHALTLAKSKLQQNKHFHSIIASLSTELNLKSITPTSTNNIIITKPHVSRNLFLITSSHLTCLYNILLIYYTHTSSVIQCESVISFLNNAQLKEYINNYNSENNNDVKIICEVTTTLQIIDSKDLLCEKIDRGLGRIKDIIRLEIKLRDEEDQKIIEELTKEDTIRGMERLCEEVSLQYLNYLNQ